MPLKFEGCCPICKKCGRSTFGVLGYTGPHAQWNPSLQCDSGHRFNNVEGDPRKPPIYAIVALGGDVPQTLAPNRHMELFRKLVPSIRHCQEWA